MKWFLLAIILTNFGALLYQHVVAAVLKGDEFGQQLEVSRTLRIRTKFGSCTCRVASTTWRAPRRFMI
jgi:hypothetical protein